MCTDPYAPRGAVRRYVAISGIRRVLVEYLQWMRQHEEQEQRSCCKVDVSESRGVRMGRGVEEVERAGGREEEEDRKCNIKLSEK
jgi:hypothetical protein